jgi:hypothetical protein
MIVRGGVMRNLLRIANGKREEKRQIWWREYLEY